MKWTKIIKKIEEQIEAGIYPGASFAYFKGNQWTECYLGQSDPEHGFQTDAGLVYDLASVSKVVGVGTVFTFLWEKGKLDIDRPVTDFLAECDYPDITIRQLLTHTTPGCNSTPFLRIMSTDSLPRRLTCRCQFPA